jgi:hypothetical protein
MQGDRFFTSSCIFIALTAGYSSLPGGFFIASLTFILQPVYLILNPKEIVMAQISKNARTTSSTHRFFCTCGGEVKMKTIFENGKVRNVAECEKCKRVERRPSDFN